MLCNTRLIRNIRIRSVITFALACFCAAINCFAQTNSSGPEEWLKRHKPEEFTGQVWVRVRISEPKDYLYNVVIDSETDPYKPARMATGTLSGSGLKPKDWAGGGGNDWGKPLPWIPPANDSEWIPAGQYTDWVKLPVSGAAQWHTAFFIKAKSETGLTRIKVRLEFAAQPAAESIFHIVEEEPDDRMAIAVRMPTTGGLEGLRMLESLTEWAKRRQALVSDLKLTAPPQLNKLKIGTWVGLGTYRTGGGNATRERAETDFQNFYNLGINSVTVMGGIDDNVFREMAQKYGIIDTTLTAWASNWRYIDENGIYNYRPDETIEQYLARGLSGYYEQYALEMKKNMPFAFSTAAHINLGDEIMPAVTAAQIRRAPPLLAYFREWLRQQNLTPEMFGAGGWENVQPVDDRAGLGTGVEYARLFYYTRRFINQYTALFYKSATNAVEKNFPKAGLIAVNYQAGPMQFGFIGNDNDLDKGQLDIFELGRQRAFKGVMMEDWVDGWDLGVGRENLAAEIMRAAGRKHNLPLASYLVGGEAVRAEYFGYLMHGVKENGLYLYGPFSNIGPAWGENKDALAQLADTTRRVKKFESLIAQASPRPAKVALLIAATSDIMQAKGLYFCPERQNLFIALQHSYVPVEVISEQDILEDNRLKDYSVLMVSDPQVRRDVQEKIADWVKNGGNLWASASALSWDEFNQPSSTLDKVFGVDERKTVFQKDGINLSGEAWSSNVRKFNYKQIDTLKTDASFFNQNIEIPVWGIKLQAAPTTAKVVGTYGDGRPAAFINDYGKGKAMLIGALVGEAYINRHYPQNLVKNGVLSPDWKFELGAETTRLAAGFIERAGISSPVSLSVPGVYTSVMETPEATLIFLNNATGHTLPKITVRVRGAGRIRSAQSTLNEKINYLTEKDGVVVFDIPLKDAEIVVLSH